MKKVFLMCALSVMTSLVLTGCGPIPELPELTEQQEKLITEYAAGLLLKYDNSYDNGILSEEELLKAEAKEQEQRAREERQKQLADEYVAKSVQAEKEKANKKSESKKDKETVKEEPRGPISLDSYSAATFMGLENLQLDYKGCEKVKSYPKDGNGIFSVDAGNGKELVVASFDLSNSSGEDVNVDMFNGSTKFSIALADGKVEPNCPTLLLDDFAVYKDSVANGTSKKVVLLFEVNEGSDLSGASIVVNTKDGEGKIGL